jgi:hypothetical protein
MNADPKVGDGSYVNRDPARNIDGFDSSDFHGRNLARDSKLSLSDLAVVNIIVDNIRSRDVPCALPYSAARWLLLLAHGVMVTMAITIAAGKTFCRPGEALSVSTI